MKRILALVLSIMAVVILVGCATQGRFAVIDIDLRDKEQIEAYKNEASVLYQNTSTNQVSAKSFDFSVLSTILSAIKGRIRIVNIEWSK
jgi:hypothetical protein